ncbi:unnamed protein product [Pleuronectes platessa]|uniref:Uncharacterized protein n=1 Tax=Pleuronectes platessa TaxID=8262 RepID=A0A9N7Z9A3_PLEPL|nr:unnamed protein product [Pleuronectes platessa]
MGVKGLVVYSSGPRGRGQGGSPFYPLTTAEESNLFGRHRGRLKFSACSGAVPCPTMAGFIRAVSQAPVTGQRHRAPSGPNQRRGPQERAIKQPYKTRLSPCIVEPHAHPPLIT